MHTGLQIVLQDFGQLLLAHESSPILQPLEVRLLRDAPLHQGRPAAGQECTTWAGQACILMLTRT